MARTKLTPEDREQLVAQYRLPGVTVANLADQFKVSSSTVSRILKENIPGEEYRALVRKKRTGRPTKEAAAPQDVAAQEATVEQPSLLEITPKSGVMAEESVGGVIATEPTTGETETVNEGWSDGLTEPVVTSSGDDDLQDTTDDGQDHRHFDDEEGFEEELAAEYFDDDDDDDEFESEEDEFDEDDDYNDDEAKNDGRDEVAGEENTVDEETAAPPVTADGRGRRRRRRRGAVPTPIPEQPASSDYGQSDSYDEQPTQVEVVGPPPTWYAAVAANPDSAIAQAPEPEPDIDIYGVEDLEPPRKCFAVVDRFQELTTCPLQEFKHLGSIPSHMSSAKTLPIFVNHRVARRFSDRFRQRGRQKCRVIDFPGYFLEVTREHLQAKGIQYVLLDNQIYEL